jgi:DNA-binding response OmpR family regulator
VVEDDAKVARLLSRVLQEEGFVVDACTSAADAITLGSSLSYDLMVLDWMLPEGSGLDVCRSLRRRGISAPIIMLTARGEVAERVLGLEAGADDYVCKPFHVDELLARVHAVLRRSQGTVSRFVVGPLEIDRTRRAATLRGALLDLHAGQVVSRTELLAHAWEARFDPGSNLVEVHVSRIRDKLGADAGCIETVRGQGYRLRAEGAP